MTTSGILTGTICRNQHVATKVKTGAGGTVVVFCHHVKEEEDLRVCLMRMNRVEGNRTRREGGVWSTKSRIWRKCTTCGRLSNSEPGKAVCKMLLY